MGTESRFLVTWDFGKEVGDGYGACFECSKQSKIDCGDSYTAHITIHIELNTLSG